MKLKKIPLHIQRTLAISPASKTKVDKGICYHFQVVIMTKSQDRNLVSRGVVRDTGVVHSETGSEEAGYSATDKVFHILSKQLVRLQKS